MGSQNITRISLAQRLGGGARRGVLQENPPGLPFWVPEENPRLLAWDMTADEYSRSVRRLTGRDPCSACAQVFDRLWPRPEGAWRRLPLITLVGRAWRLLCPDQTDQAPWEASIGVWRQWKVQPPEEPAETPEDFNQLSRAVAELMLMPFALLEGQRQAGPARRKEGKK